MLKQIDFSYDTSIVITLMACLCFPIILWLITRITVFKNRNAFQFFITTLILSVTWLSSLYITHFFSHFDITLFFTNIFILLSALLVYLEIWGILSRGYTLGLLLTFYKSQQPLTVVDLSNAYRNGQGLNWLIEHRLGGLIAANMIRKNENSIQLTKKGSFVTWLYQLFIRFFGLRYTG